MKPTFPDQGPWKGTYKVKGNRLTFVYESAGKNQPVPEPDELTWSYFDGQLRFQIVDVLDSASRVLYIAHPWKKVR